MIAGLACVEGTHIARPKERRHECPNQTWLHELALDLNPAGIEASIEPATAHRIAADHKCVGDTTQTKQPIQRAGTKQAMLIALLQSPEGATMDTIMAATSWQSHTVRGAMSGALGKKLGLILTSAKEGGGARVYRISPGLT